MATGTHRGNGVHHCFHDTRGFPTPSRRPPTAEMVVFVCEQCSDTLKKKAAEVHFSCRPARLTCVDCSVTFFGEDFRSHTTCVSEAEKYQKGLYKGGGKQKRDPQAEWTEAVCKAAESATKHKALLQLLTGFSNVPRKLKPFVNFAKNTVKVYNDRTLEELFGLIQAAAPPRPAQPAAAKAEEEAGEEVVAARPAGQKRKRLEDGGDEAPAGEKKVKAAPAGAASSGGPVVAFSMKVFLLAQVKLEGGKTKLKRLRKRAVEAAVKGGVSEEDAEEAYDKKYARLVKKGQLAEDDAGKFVVLVRG